MAGKKRKKQPKNLEPRIENRRARHDYHLSDALECGISLMGSEVKAIRHGTVSLAEAYVRLDDKTLELVLVNADIGLYPQAGVNQHAPRRPRKLLAHKREIKNLSGKVLAKGATIVPMAMYFKSGLIKLEIAIGLGKKQHDKRQDLKSHQAKRDMDRAMTRKVLR